MSGHAPAPTAAPAALAASILLLGWGLIASPVLVLAGAAGAAASLAVWIAEIAHGE